MFWTYQCMSCLQQEQEWDDLFELSPMNFSLHLVSCLVGHNKIKGSRPYCNILRCHNQCGGGYCLPNCVQVILCAHVLITTKIIEIITELKNPPLKTVVTSMAKKLKSNMDTSRSISRQILKSPIQRDVRSKCEDKFWIKKRNQQLKSNSMQIQQSLNPLDSTQS